MVLIRLALGSLSPSLCSSRMACRSICAEISAIRLMASAETVNGRVCIEPCILICYLLKISACLLQSFCMAFAVILQIPCSETALFIAVLLHKHCSSAACCVQCGCITRPSTLHRSGLPAYRLSVPAGRQGREGEAYASEPGGCRNNLSPSLTSPDTPPPSSPVPKSGNGCRA